MQQQVRQPRQQLKFNFIEENRFSGFLLIQFFIASRLVRGS